MSETSPTLTPTLWRTCRALANHRRLRILQHLMELPDRTVSQVARHLRMPLAATSQYLRALNARGLLRATRHGRWVLYRAEADPAVPQAESLLCALEATFRTRSRPVDEAFAALTALTHPRRILLVQTLACAPLGLAAIQRRTGISKHAALRHLRKLEKRGWVGRKECLYRLTNPKRPLAMALRQLAAATR